PGWRANATIGRALRLVCVNVGGARPGVVSMSTFAHPGRYTYCIGEHEEASPWDSLAVEHGFAPGDDTVALLAADAPLTVYDQRSRTAPDLLATVAASMAVIEHHKMTHWGDTLLVLSPEHAAVVAGDGWSKADVRRFLFERLQRPVHELVPGKNGGDGLPEHVLRKFADPEHDATPIPKFRAPEHIQILGAGGTSARRRRPSCARRSRPSRGRRPTRCETRSSAPPTCSSRRSPTEGPARRAVCTTACSSRITVFPRRRSSRPSSPARRRPRRRRSAPPPIARSWCSIRSSPSRATRCARWPTRCSTRSSRG